jgi:hypothetical protein
MFAQIVCGLLIAITSLTLSSCHAASYYYYKFPEYTFANRPIPPSRLANRVMASVTANGSTGTLAILDASRDIRSNVQNTIRTFSISGFSSGQPTTILNFPEQVHGYVYSATDGSLTVINYSTEATGGSAGTLPAVSAAVSVATDSSRIYSAEEAAGLFYVIDNNTSRAFALNLPNVYQVAVNQGNTVVLAMVRNSNTLYRLIKLNANAPTPPGAVDCQPYNLPVYCVVPVPGNFDRPSGAYFSLDGTTAYILNAGPEYGGQTASVTLVQQAALTVDVIPTSVPYPSVTSANVPVPGGATAVVSDGNNLYLAGQQKQPDGLFAGFLSTMSLATNTITGTYSISDGNHSKLLFGDDNTLWIGSQFCSNGERAKLGQNYNCLTRFDLGAKSAQVIPNVAPGGATTVPFPNDDENAYYYGSLTGLCWVQGLHKMYTAYGGQIHAFNTADGSEINNQYIKVQGTALDVAYMDAATNAAD